MDPLFVVGCHLSGKTLLARLLDRHPDCLSIRGETQVFHKHDNLRRFGDLDQRFLHLTGRPYDNSRSRKLAFETPIERSTNWQKHLYWQGIEDAGVGQHAEQRLKMVLRKGGAGDIFREICTIYVEAVGGGKAFRYCVEDTPHNEFHCDEILSFFPSARFIHIVRDPFDALAARVGHRAGQIANRDLIGLGLLWRTSLYKGIALSRKYPGHYRVIRFEDLIADTTREMAEVCRFLELGFDESLARAMIAENRHVEADGGERAHGVFIDKQILNSNAEEVFGKAQMALMAPLWRQDYAYLGYVKYAQHIAKARLMTFLGKASSRQIAHYVTYWFERFRLGPGFPGKSMSRVEDLR
jgi:hypothetical protein